MGGCACKAALELRSGSPPVPVVTIVTPRSGEAVTSERVTVSGSAPAGSSVVRDVAFRPDDDVIAGRDGRWSFEVRLDDGADVLT